MFILVCEWELLPLDIKQQNSVEKIYAASLEFMV
jgi:hypothetical protein